MVYFMQGEKTGLIKVGWAIDAEKRLKSLQTGSPDRLTILAVIENQHKDAPYHTQFRKAWAFGEWFNPTPELMKFIDTLPKHRTRGIYRTAVNHSVDPSAPQHRPHRHTN